MGSKVHLELHLLFSVERVEVVVVGELGAAGDLPESKQTNPVDSIHRPGGQITFKHVQYVINNTINLHKQPDTKKQMSQFGLQTIKWKKCVAFI